MSTLPHTISVSWRELFRDRDIVIGDTLLVPVERIKSAQTRLNQLGYGTRREPCDEPGHILLRIVQFGTTQTNRELYIRELRTLSTKQLAAVVESCRQNGLIK